MQPILAKIWTEIVDQTLKLHIGGIIVKFASVVLLAVTAQLARDQKLFGKARDILKKLMEDVKLEYMRIGYGFLEEKLTRFSDRRSPRRRKSWTHSCNYMKSIASSGRCDQ